LDGLPKDTHVHTEVFVGEQVAHTLHVTPRYFWPASQYLIRQIGSRLADDLQIALHSIYRLAIRLERVEIKSGATQCSMLSIA